MIFNETKEYQLNGDKQTLPGFDEKYVNIVDYILKITEEIWEKRAIWVIYDTYDENIILHSGAATTTGIDQIIAGTLKALSAFPDRKMGGETVIWSKVDDNHFYSSHRIGSTATNLGPTVFGEASGKKIFFRTIADCLVSENKIVEEWLVRDNLHMVIQLGFDPVEMAKLDTRYNNKNLHDIHNSNVVNSKAFSAENLAVGEPTRLILSLFENVWNKKDFDSLKNYYHPLGFVHAICEKDLIGPRLINEYLAELLASFPDAHIQVERVSCNIKNGGFEVAARWRLTGKHNGNGFFGPASGKNITVPGISHYFIKDNKITEEWMVFDGYDVLCQIHSTPQKQTAEKHDQNDDIHLSNKKIVLAFINELNEAGNSTVCANEVFNTRLSKDITLNITRPFSEMNGIKDFSIKFWEPLLKSFPDLENRPYILMGGEYEGRKYVSFTGTMVGTFDKDWLGIPATGQPVWIRYAAHFQIANDKISNAWYFLDILDVMRQAGFHFFPNKGIECVPPGPLTGDGIVTYKTQAADGKKSMELTNAMLDSLGSYDKKSLDSMDQELFWDVKNMMWYGPSGIGTTKGLKGFQDNHQVPFLKAFPNRGITPKNEETHFAQYADGMYSVDFGFPSMYATHKGDGWLGLKATGKKVTLHVMDFWRREGNCLKENWVFIDMIDVLEQFGIDVFDLLKKENQSKK